MTDIGRRAVLIAATLIAGVLAFSSPALSADGPQPPVAAAAMPGWTVADPDALPDDAFGRTVRYGRDLIAHTSALIGPDATDPAMRFSGNGLECQSCHLQAGTGQFALPLAGAWGVFPTFMGRENAVRTLAERINGCMERSMNGRPLPATGAEMKAILTYIRFISGGQTVGRPLAGHGTPPLPLPDVAADPQRGAAVYAAHCAACHQPDGQGLRLDAAAAAEQRHRYQVPPLWGPDSYSDGAGMARSITAARFVRANMPLGTDFAHPVLQPDEAFDVAAFINGQQRPHSEGLEADYPNRFLKPADAPFPPFIGPFPPEQHRLGPWKPIRQWLRDNDPDLRR